MYERIFKPYKDSPISILEIDVLNGGSLEIWAKYFSNAKAIIGCDINQKCSKLTFEDKRIHVVIEDVKRIDCIKKITNISESFDIIIDDGSHKPEDIIKAFVNLFPCLNDGGLYIVEDLHANYWEDHNGGVFEPTTAISFLKRLIDVVNYEAWNIGIPRKEVLKPLLELYGVDIDDAELARIHFLEFLNSLCIIRKEKLCKNSLGHHMVVGSHSEVVPAKSGIGPRLVNVKREKVVFDREKDPILNLKPNQRTGSKIE